MKRDAANGVYMGEEYIACQNKYVSKVAPDRAKAIAQVSQKLDTVHYEPYEDYWMMLLDIPYKASINVGTYMTTAHVYNENGEGIADYNSMNGWTLVPTKAEEEFWMTAHSIYSQMFDEAKRELAATAQNPGDLENTNSSTALNCLA